MISKKSWKFSSWKLASLEKSKDLFCAWFVVLDLFQLIALLKQESNSLCGFTSSWVDKVPTGTISFVSVISIVFLDLLQYQLIENNLYTISTEDISSVFKYHVNWTLPLKF